MQPVAQRVQLRGHGAEHLRRATGDRDMHLLAADVDKRGVRIQNRQITHIITSPSQSSDREASPQARSRSEHDKSFQREASSPKCAIVRDRSQSNDRAVERTKGISGHAARGKTPQHDTYPVHGPCAVSAETGRYLWTIEILRRLLIQFKCEHAISTSSERKHLFESLQSSCLDLTAVRIVSWQHPELNLKIPLREGA